MVGQLVDDMNAFLLIDENPTYVRTIFKLKRNVVLVGGAAFPNSVIYFVHDDKKWKRNWQYMYNVIANTTLQ